MRLFIDNNEADIDTKTDVILSFTDEEFKINTLSDQAYHVPIKLPMTENNAKIFGFAYDPNEEILFNNRVHQVILKKSEAIIFSGTIVITDCVHRSNNQIAEGYFNCMLRRTESWLTMVKQSMFNEIPIAYDQILSGSTIKKSWEQGQIIKFLPVRRDRFHSSKTSNTLVKYEQIIPAHGYHPFIHIRTLLESMVGQSGYSINSIFLKQKLFDSLHISGNYIQNSDTTANMKKSVDFCAARLTNKSATADQYGIVYASPIYPRNSFGAIVETADPNKSIGGYKALGVFNTNNTFSMDAGIPTFAPSADMNVAFEYNLSFNSEYEIVDRSTLRGFDTIRMNDGLKFKFIIPNSFTDHKESIISGHKYWVRLFDDSVVDHSVYIKYTSGTGEEQTAHLRFVTKLNGNQTDPMPFICNEDIVEVRIYNSAGYRYTKEWALYSDINLNTGNIDIGLIFRTNFEKLKASNHKLLDDISFGGAKEGMKFTIGRNTSVRPLLLPHPGIGSKIDFQEVAAHQIRQVKLFEALQHLFNMRFYTDYVNKIVHIEPRDMIYKTDNIVDWSTKVDTQKPIAVAEMGKSLPRKRTKLFKTGDGEVAKFNIANRCTYASWVRPFSKYVSNELNDNDSNQVFTATRSISNEIISAPSASIIHAGDRTRHSILLDEELNFCPKIVSYVGMIPLKSGELWGYPSYSAEYPYVTFFDKNRDISLRFDDDGIDGLHKYFDNEYLTEEYSREITLNLWLTPQDVEAFADTAREGPNFRSLFIINIGGEKHRLRMKEIQNYNPNSGDSTKCKLFKEL